MEIKCSMQKNVCLLHKSFIPRIKNSVPFSDSSQNHCTDHHNENHHQQYHTQQCNLRPKKICYVLHFGNMLSMSNE